MSVPPVPPEIPDLIAAQRDEIAALCREYGVARLEVFGSVMTDEFDPEKSDNDFMIEYVPDGELDWWSSEWCALKARLADVLGRKVDLVTFRALEDPFFRQVANMTRTPFYHERSEALDGAGAEPDRGAGVEDRVAL